MENITINTKMFSSALKRLKEIAGGQTMTGETIRFDVSNTEMKMTVRGAHGTTMMVMLPVMNLGEPAAFVVDSKKLSSIIPQVNCEDITLMKARSGLRISGGGLKMELPYFELSSFREVGRLTDPEMACTVSADEFKEKIASTVHALAINRTGEKVSTFYVEFTDDGIRMTTTDERRIAIHGPKGEPVSGIMLPNEAIRKVAKYFSGDITIKKVEDTVEIADDSTVLTINALAGNYFNIAKVVQTMEPGCTYWVTVKKGELLRSLEMSLAMDRENCLLTVADEALYVTAKNAEGAFQQVIEAESNTGNEDKKAFLNAQYLVDAIRSLKEDTVTIRFGNVRTPFILSEEGATEILFLKNA